MSFIATTLFLFKTEPMSDITQPTAEEQAVYDSIANNTATEITLPGTDKTYKIEWLKRGAMRRIGHIITTEKTEDKVTCKVAAAIILNGYWGIKFKWWFLWRWFYYIRQYGDEQLGAIIEEGKKKVPVQSYYVAIILATGMKDTMMTMTRAEVDHFLQERTSGQPTR